jgi:acyl carrier protein
MVQQAVGTCIVGVAESLITPERDARAESSTESCFAEVLAELVHVERVSVDSNFFDDLGADSMVMAHSALGCGSGRTCLRCRSRTFTNTPRSQAWPRPSPTPRPVPLERVLADVLTDVVRAERVSVDSNFFDDLGADSMVMAQFCARVRKRPDLPSVSIKDIYQHPTIASLAAALADAAARLVESPAPVPVEVAKRAGTWQVFLCGALQLVAFLYISLSPHLLWPKAMTGFRRAQVCSTSTSGR